MILGRFVSKKHPSSFLNGLWTVLGRVGVFLFCFFNLGLLILIFLCFFWCFFLLFGVHWLTRQHYRAYWFLFTLYSLIFQSFIFFSIIKDFTIYYQITSSWTYLILRYQVAEPRPTKIIKFELSYRDIVVYSRHQTNLQGIY